MELVVDTGGPVWFEPVSLTARPSSATLSVRSPSNVEKGTPTVTVASVGSGGTSTVATVTDQRRVTVDDATGLVAGHSVWVETADGFKGAMVLDEVEGTTVIFETMCPGTLTDATTIHGLRLTATVTGAMVDTKALFWRLQWSITDADSAVTAMQDELHVVRMAYREPVTGSDVAGYVEANYPHVAQQKTAGYFRRIARRANQRVRQQIRMSGDYPHMMGDPGSFRLAGLAAIRHEMTYEGVLPGGVEVGLLAYQTATLRHVGSEVAQALANQHVDADDDGIVGTEESGGMIVVNWVRT